VTLNPLKLSSGQATKPTGSHRTKSGTVQQAWRRTLKCGGAKDRVATEKAVLLDLGRTALALTRKMRGTIIQW